MISRHPIFTGFRKLTDCQRDPWDRGVIVDVEPKVVEAHFHALSFLGL